MFRVDGQLGTFQSTFYSCQILSYTRTQLRNIFNSFIRRVKFLLSFDFSFIRFKTASKSSGELTDIHTYIRKHNHTNRHAHMRIRFKGIRITCTRLGNSCIMCYVHSTSIMQGIKKSVIAACF